MTHPVTPEEVAAIRERRAAMPSGDYTQRNEHDDWGMVRRPDGMPFANVGMSVDYAEHKGGDPCPPFVEAKREFVAFAASDIGTLLNHIDELTAERNFLEQNETVVWEVLQLPDGSTIHDVAAAVFKMRAELAAANQRADAAEFARDIHGENAKVHQQRAEAAAKAERERCVKEIRERAREVYRRDTFDNDRFRLALGATADALARGDSTNPNAAPRQE